MKTFFKRMIGAARFDAHTYEQIEADKTSTPGAVAVVLIASVAAAVGLGACALPAMRAARVNPLIAMRKE